MTRAPGNGPTTRPRAPRRRAWSTPRTISRPRPTAVTSRPPRSRATTPDDPATEHGASACSATPSRCRTSQPGGQARRAPSGRTHRDRTRRRARATTSRRRAGAAPRISGLLLLRVGRRRTADRARPAEGVRLVGRPGPRRLPAVADRHGLPARRHPDLRRRQAARSPPGVLLVLGLFTPLAAAARAGLPDQRAAGRGLAAQHDAGYFAFFLPDGHEYQVMLLVAWSAAIILIGPGRYGFDAGRGWARRPVHRLVRRAGAGRRRAASPSGCCSTAATRWPDQLPYGLGTRPPLAAVSNGSVANVTAGSRNSAPSLSCATPTTPVEPQPVDVGPRDRPAAQQRARGHRVAVGHRAVAGRSIADAMTGMTSSSANQRPASTSASRPSAKKPTAKCAIGEIRMTTAAVEGGAHTRHLPLGVIPSCRSTIPACHALDHPGGAGNLTFDQCGGYRRLLCRPRDCS